MGESEVATSNGKRERSRATKKGKGRETRSASKLPEYPRVVFSSGKIERVERHSSDGGVPLAVGGSPIALMVSKFFYDDVPVHVAWAFGPNYISPADMLHAAVMQAAGEADFEYDARYSDLTGYLYINEAAVVGGHDLMAVFAAHEGEYGALLIQDAPIDLGELVERFENEGTEVKQGRMGVW